MEDNDQNVTTWKGMEAGSSEIMEESVASDPWFKVKDECMAFESKHKVFLSHSGAQKNFVEQLFLDLESCNRSTFFDRMPDIVPIGKKFPNLIFDAIQQCQVGVLVLSAEFLMHSKWPMLELVAMVRELKKPNSSIKILPVLYQMSLKEWLDPRNYVRWISQWEKWARYNKRIHVEEWKEALEVVRPIVNLVMDKNMNEMKLRQEIVDAVCMLVPPSTKWNDYHILGRSRLCRIVSKKINQQEQRNGIRVLGLYGVGGIGKTTICKALCNEFFQKFHGKVCHVELKSGDGVERLRKVLRTFTNTSHELWSELNIDQCRNQLNRCSMKDAVFLAIDNVSDNLQVIREARTYLGAQWGNGSEIIVTGRSLSVLMLLDQYLDQSACIEMPELEDEEARLLLLKHVTSGRDARIEMDEQLVSSCIKRCYFFKGESRGYHYHPLALKVLGNQLEYDGYDATQWDEKFRRNETLRLEFANEEHPIFSILRASFDSLSNEDQLLFIDVALFLPYVGGGGLDKYNWSEWLSIVHGSNVNEMTRRLKKLEQKSLLETLDDGFTRISMHDLWREFCAFEIRFAGELGNRSWMSLEKKSSELEDSYPPWSHRCWVNLTRMRFLNEDWKGLHKVNLNYCTNVLVLKVEIGSFVPSTTLDLDLGNFKHVKSLELNTGPWFIAKWMGLGLLTDLVFLSWISNEASSPCKEEIEHLTNLQVLNVENFQGDTLPSMEGLTSLQLASFAHSPEVVTVTGLSSKLSNLRILKIEYCASLQECPGLGDLCALEEVSLLGCPNLRELPYLQLLIRLRVLNISYCKSLKAVPDLSGLVSLEEFRASNCDNLPNLPDMQKLTKLEVLICTGLQRLDVLDLDKFPQCLKVMSFARCRALKSLTCTRPLHSLREIDLTLCKSLEEMPDLSNFPQLEVLFLSGCASLGSLTSSEPSLSLRILDVEGCSKLNALPNHLSSSVDLGELCLQKSGIVWNEDDTREPEASCKSLDVFPSSFESRYGSTPSEGTSWSDMDEGEYNAIDINPQSLFQSRRSLDPLQGEKVTSDNQQRRTIETVHEMIDEKKENDDVRPSEHGFINSLKNQMKAMTFIQVVEIEEAFSKLQDQAIIVLGFFNTVADNIEFVFENGKNMAKLVGIGLEHGKVVVKRGIIIEVQEIEAEKWKTMWLEVKDGSNRSFKIMKVTLPRTTLSRSCMENMQDGGASNSAPCTAFQVPLLWELSKYFIMERVIATFHTKVNADILGESSTFDFMEDYPKDGNDTVMTWSETLKVLFGNGISRLYGNNVDTGNQGENQEGGSGGGSGDGNDGDGHLHGSKSNNSLPKDRFAKSQVKVILLSGGNMEPLANRPEKSIERLNNVKISPELTFDFYKSKDFKKIQITTSVIFGLDPECDGLDPDCDGYDCDCPNHFGWFHDKIRASIGPFDENIHSSVRLEHNFKEEEFVPGKTVSKVSEAMEATNINERGIQGGGTIGSTHLAQFRFGANMNRNRGLMDHQSNEQSSELECRRTHPGGCSIIATPVVHKALLGYKYSAPPFEITVDRILEKYYRECFSNHAMCRTQTAKFSGTWVPNEDAEGSVYIFKSSRRLREIVARADVSSRSSSSRFGKSKKSKVRSTLEFSITETYEKKLYVDYAMTQLIDGESYDLLESSNTQIPVQNLVNLFRHDADPNDRDANDGRLSGKSSEH